MKSIAIFLACLAMTVMAANQLPVQQVRASETLPNQGKNNYNVKNLLDENWATIWAAPFKGGPISLEFDLNAYEVAAIYIENGYWRDIKSMVNNSRAKNVNIYINSKTNLALSIDLKDGKEIYEGEPRQEQESESVKEYIRSKKSPSSKNDKEGQFITLPKVYNNVKKVILEINSIYKGQKWNDLCISAVEFYGQRTNPIKVKSTTGSIGPYTTVTIEGTTWMAEDLEDLDNGAGFTRHSAKNACPAGWRLPTQAEWKRLVKIANGVENLVKEPLQFYSHHCSEGVCELSLEYAVNRLNFGMVIDPKGGFYDGECSTGENFGGVSYWTSDYTSIVTTGFSEDNIEREVRYDYVAFMRYAMDSQDGYCSLQTLPDYPDVERHIRCVKK